MIKILKNMSFVDIKNTNLNHWSLKFLIETFKKPIYA